MTDEKAVELQIETKAERRRYALLQAAAVILSTSGLSFHDAITAAATLLEIIEQRECL